MLTTGRSKLRTRLRPVFHKAGDDIRHRAKIVRLKHGGNWATQPFALDYVSRKLIAENRVAIDFTDGAAIDGKSLAGNDLAWMTGTDKFTLTGAEIKALRDFIDGGGTLFANAVGGAPDFNDAVEDMVEKLFAGRNVASGRASPTSPLWTGKAADFRGPKITKLLPTWALEHSPLNKTSPLRVHMSGGRMLVIHGTLGIHDTLDGHTTYEAKSFMPKSSRELAANIVLYALSLRGTVKAPAPTTQPAAAAD